VLAFLGFAIYSKDVGVFEILSPIKIFLCLSGSIFDFIVFWQLHRRLTTSFLYERRGKLFAYLQGYKMPARPRGRSYLAAFDAPQASALWNSPSQLSRLSYFVR
jgi:hypothetical protein